MKKALIAAVAAGVIAAMAAPAASHAAPDADPAFALHGFSNLLVDGAHGHVFVSEGSWSDVVVLGIGGRLVTRIDQIDDAAGMALSADGTTLFVASPDSDEVVAVDTGTLAVTKRYDTGEDSCPRHLAFAADRLWFTGACVGGGHLDALDPATGEVFSELQGDVFLSGAPLLTAIPGVPDTLATYDGEARLWAVDSGAPPSATVTASREISDDAYSMTATTDGRELLLASDPPYYHLALSTTDLSTVRRYHTGPYPVATASRPDGMVAAGTVSGDHDITFYVPTKDLPYGHYDFPAGTELAHDGLAFGTSRLYAVTETSTHENQELRVVWPKTNSSVRISTNRRAYLFNAAAVVTAHLTGGVVNRGVAIYAKAGNSAPHLVKSGRVDANGNLSATVHVHLRTTFSVRYMGDAHTYPSTATAPAVQVHAKVTDRLIDFYKIVGRYRLYHANQDPIQTTAVAPNKHGRCVFYQAQLLVGGHWRSGGTSRCVRLDEQSRTGVRLTGDHADGQHIRIRAEWRGDAVNLPAVGNWSYLRFTS